VNVSDQHNAARLHPNETERLRALRSCDLKQPLQVMVMAIERVRAKLTGPKDRERLGYAVDAGLRMAEELDQLAETSALQAGFGAPQLKTFPIAEVFESILNTWSLHAETRGGG
jgi:hypothetical protein